MDPQRYIISLVEAEMNETGEMPWLKFISETSLLPVEDYPALLVEDVKPYGTDNEAGDGTMLTRTGDYMISLIIQIPNLKDMKREDYRKSKTEAVKRIEEIEIFLCRKWKENNSLVEDEKTVIISGMNFEKAELGFIEIDSRPALILQMPVTAGYIIN